MWSYLLVASAIAGAYVYNRQRRPNASPTSSTLSSPVAADVPAKLSKSAAKRARKKKRNQKEGPASPEPVTETGSTGKPSSSSSPPPPPSSCPAVPEPKSKPKPQSRIPLTPTPVASPSPAPAPTSTSTSNQTQTSKPGPVRGPKGATVNRSTPTAKKSPVVPAEPEAGKNSDSSSSSEDDSDTEAPVMAHPSDRESWKSGKTFGILRVVSKSSPAPKRRPPPSSSTPYTATYSDAPARLTKNQKVTQKRRELRQQDKQARDTLQEARLRQHRRERMEHEIRQAKKKEKGPSPVYSVNYGAMGPTVVPTASKPPTQAKRSQSKGQPQLIWDD
ncbi:hypothetical protein H4R33_002084 [Dimargaris cristalligena]|nr:hypothetical protein H4R33_002084 [Dimargaris cristalligena]